MSRHDVIDFDILWTILNQDLPPLIEALEATMKEGRIDDRGRTTDDRGQTSY